jgi:hypothetical protein
MDIFHCDHCGQLVFENTQCVRCGHRLAYLPDVAQMGSFESPDGGLWHSSVADAARTEYRWFPITYVLNNLNRALGLPDGYPFVLPPPAIEKMHFVHDTVGVAAAPSP